MCSIWPVMLKVVQQSRHVFTTGPFRGYGLNSLEKFKLSGPGACLDEFDGNRSPSPKNQLCKVGVYCLSSPSHTVDVDPKPSFLMIR